MYINKTSNEWIAPNGIEICKGSYHTVERVEQLGLEEGDTIEWTDSDYGTLTGTLEFLECTPTSLVVEYSNKTIIRLGKALLGGAATLRQARDELNDNGGTYEYFDCRWYDGCGLHR